MPGLLRRPEELPSAPDRTFRDNRSLWNAILEERLRANVVLTRNSDGAVWGAMSLGGGQFFLNGIPAGQYTLKVLYLGFKPVEEAVTVTVRGAQVEAAQKVETNAQNGQKVRQVFLLIDKGADVNAPDGYENR